MSIDDSTHSLYLRLWFSRVSEITLAAEDKVLAWLSPSELARLQRFGHERRHREYLMSRALMREALSHHYQRPANEWHFTENAGSPPSIAGLPANTHFSLSHSHGYLCFALAGCPVGIDIEVINPDRDFQASARIFMDTDEREQLQSEDSRATDFFYRAWCAKEACYKSLSPDCQATTSLQSINYPTLRAGQRNRRLIEGESAEFRFAAALACSPDSIEQHSFLETVSVTLETTC